ncbi:response regulator transcription factor [Telmatobacter bradus]|uniref:response regulator transcription factor n=1 Tax=Telmatobacter bradus TaxID=474953 RepID=UPI003B432DD2
MKVLLADDNALFLEGLQDLLEDNGIVVLGTANNAQEAVAQAIFLTPDVVLMDIQMPGKSGIAATRAIKSKLPGMKIVMMTVSQNETHLFEAIAAGASGYLLKSMPQKDFVEALAGMARGESPFSPGLAAKILAEFAHREQQRKARQRKAAPKVPALSERQMQILHMVAQGRPYKEVAFDLGLAEATIKYHMGEIADLLHLENRAQAIAYASKLHVAPDSLLD